VSKICSSSPDSQYGRSRHIVHCRIYDVSDECYIQGIFLDAAYNQACPASWSHFCKSSRIGVPVCQLPCMLFILIPFRSSNVSEQCSKGLASFFPAAWKAELIEEEPESESEDDDVNHANMQPRGTLIERILDGEDDETPAPLVKSPTLHHHPVMRTLHHQTRNNFDQST
jgi:hypothetical protein